SHTRVTTGARSLCWRVSWAIGFRMMLPAGCGSGPGGNKKRVREEKQERQGHVRGTGRSCRKAAALAENPDQHAPVLGASFLGLVRRDRLVGAVADHVH